MGLVVRNPPASAGDVKRSGFDPWVRKISWRRAWQPTPVFVFGEFSWTEEPGALQSLGSQRVSTEATELLSKWASRDLITHFKFPAGSDGKESACIVGDPDLIPGCYWIFQYSRLENPCGQRSLMASVHGIAKSRTWLCDKHTLRILTILSHLLSFHNSTVKSACYYFHFYRWGNWVKKKEVVSHTINKWQSQELNPGNTYYSTRTYKRLTPFH